MEPWRAVEVQKRVVETQNGDLKSMFTSGSVVDPDLLDPDSLKIWIRIHHFKLIRIRKRIRIQSGSRVLMTKIEEKHTAKYGSESTRLLVVTDWSL
jgi:hypothetical protein